MCVLRPWPRRSMTTTSWPYAINWLITSAEISTLGDFHIEHHYGDAVVRLVVLLKPELNDVDGGGAQVNDLGRWEPGGWPELFAEGGRQADDGHETRKRDFSLITESIRAENGF